MNNTTQTPDKEQSPVRISFAAIDQTVERPLPSAKETVSSSGEFVKWGDGNAFPDYLLELYETVPDLAAVIDGCVDYAAGNDVRLEYLGRYVNKGRDTVLDFVRNVERDMFMYGGFAFQVVRNLTGGPVELYYIDLRFLRSNKDNTVFYYCEDWGKTGRRKVLTYPAFMPGLDWSVLTEEERAKAVSSIVYVKAGSKRVYPTPRYIAALRSCETERNIDEYNMNAIRNGFMSSAIVNFNNGAPSDEIKEEIEKDFTSKFSGAENAGRILFSWNPNKESATTIDYPKIDDFGDRYTNLSKTVRQRIFTAFRANPNLFGIPTESLGFSSEEYDSAFRLFNRTTIKPAQRLLTDAVDRVFGFPALMIEPFTLDGGEAVVK